MNLWIKFFAKPSAPNVTRYPIPYPTGELGTLKYFATLEDARKTAFADADKIKAHSIIIESEDGIAVSERWAREGAGWKRENA